jgi:opacity protein-like surface antigen
MRRYVLLVVIFVSLCILAPSARAQTYYRFELYGSANIPRDKDFEISMPQSTTPLEGKLQMSPGVRGGVRLGVDGLRHWGQDITYSYGINAAKIKVNPNGEFAFTSRTHQFAYNAVFYPVGLNRSKAIPYVTAGAGGTFFTLSQKSINEAFAEGLGNLKNHVSFVFNVGGGVRIQFNDKVGIRFDVRDWMSHPPRYGIPASSTDPQTFVFPVNGVFQQIETSVAFVYCFRNSRR